KTLFHLPQHHLLQTLIQSLNIINQSPLITHHKNFLLPLTHHIIYPYKTLKQHQIITNPFLIQTKHLYTNPYNLPPKLIHKLNKTLHLHFPQHEIPFIPLHI
ncbi:PRD domain-containing protein, partial [Staphylococcus epidermidis]|uniref:PRD domain-containing protein n=1 Tax=Staphylococcus epidermidis TaxID=1282 RepID=UPI0011A9A070